MLLIKPQSEDPKTAIDKCWQDQVNQKAVRILAHQKLRKLLRLGIKNYLLNLKSEKSKNYITSFKMEHYNWVSLFDKDDSQVAIKALYKNAETTKYLDILYSVQRQLFNILNNHYSIRNSLDTHFIMGRLNEVNQVLNKTRESLNKPFIEENDESFNPFIDIADTADKSSNEEIKEAGFVDAGGRAEKMQNAIDELNHNLESEATRLKETLDSWLSELPEPDALNIGAKQASLTRKLRWEKILTSSEKLRQYKTIFKMLRAKKSKK